MARSDDGAVAIPTEVLTALLSALGDVQRAVGASGTADAAAAATRARVMQALRAAEPYLRELSGRRDADHRAEVEAAYQRGHDEGVAAGKTEGHRVGHEAGKLAAAAERRGMIEALTAPVATFASTKGGAALLASVALPLAVLLLRACVIGGPVAIPGADALPAMTVEVPGGP